MKISFSVILATVWLVTSALAKDDSGVIAVRSSDCDRDCDDCDDREIQAEQAQSISYP